MPLPKPRTGEAQDNFISRCMSNETIKKDFGKGSKQAQAVCFSQWRRSKQMNNIQLSFKVPIEVIEQPTSGETGKDTEFLIQGVAINATVSDNKHKFLGEELDSAAGTLRNVPLLKNHDNMVESIVGRVIDVEYVPAKENIRFKARINNTEIGKHVKELIKIGDLNTVSIGANVETLDEENGLFIPRGIVFKELSLVAVPADSGAKFTFTGNSFELALKEAYESQSQTDIVSKELNKQEKEDMEDEQKKTEPEASEESEEKEEEKVDETSDKIDALSKLVAESIADNKKVSERITKLELADADEESEAPAEEPEKEEPAEVPEPEAKEPEEEPEAEDEEEEEGEEESVDEKGYKIVQEHTSFSVVRNKY